MRFEWDRAKAASNRRKHGISFDEAVTVFYDPLAATVSDPDHSAHEDRLITVGYSAQEQLLVVCHTERRGAIRIISARHATPRERKRHENDARD
ncbi:MAG: BrnT family toxin [Terriglobia bacterium]